MSQKNKDKMDKTAEDITKNLFNKTFNSDNKNNDIYEESNVYYEDEYYEYDDFEDDEIPENTYNTRKSSQNNIKRSYRKNIDKYGKNFFENNVEDEPEKSSFGKFLNFAVMAVLVISTSVLAFSLISTKKEIKKLEEENQNLLIKNQDAENKLLQDSLKNKITELEAKNQELQNMLTQNNTSNPNSNNTEKQTEATTQSKPQDKPTESKPNKTNSNNSSFSEYTVKENDSFWKISKAIYGTGSKYQLILDANNLTENSKLTPGQKLKIPKSN